MLLLFSYTLSCVSLGCKARAIEAQSSRPASQLASLSWVPSRIASAGKSPARIARNATEKKKFRHLLSHKKSSSFCRVTLNSHRIVNFPLGGTASSSGLTLLPVWLHSFVQQRFSWVFSFLFLRNAGAGVDLLTIGFNKKSFLTKSLYLLANPK